MKRRIHPIILALGLMLPVEASGLNSPASSESSPEAVVPAYAAPVVEFVTPSVARVRWNPEGTVTDNATGVCVYEKRPVDVRVRMEGTIKVLRTDSLEVWIQEDGCISFIDPVDDKLLLFQKGLHPKSRERVPMERVVYDDASARMEDTANGKVTVKDVVSRDTLGFKDRYTLSFFAPGEQALYGLGSHMEDYMDLSGKTLWLTQHNLKAFVPVMVSTNGYGLLLDAGCSMKFQSDVYCGATLPENLKGGGGRCSGATEPQCSPTTGNSATICSPIQGNPVQGGPEIQDITFTMEAAKTVDYYFMKGNAEQVTAEYRFLTGPVSMMPRYIFGYVQSKERFVSSDDIVNTLKEYRRREVPLDVIVQDWNYWPQGWGYMKMNREFYPDPKALADSVHAYDAKLMVSIWPNPQYCPEEDDFRNRGLMLEHSVYDAFNPKARDLYWQYADDEFFSNGFDAWWCDSSEPLDGDWNRMPEPENGKPYSWDDHERRWRLNDEVLSETLTPERACLYSLYHAKGIYEHQRRATDEKRVVNLTRSPFAGQQRFGTILWNGDTHASWASFRRQIPSGLNYFATGNPYWTVDVGCFFTGRDGRWFRCGDFPDGVHDNRYKELYTRMFQWATFLPVLRSHGTDTPREIWQFGEPGTPYYDAILKMINLRYSLLPYNYSMAALQTWSGYSMVRPLGLDFPADSKTHDIKDQYMFGDIMVCPVTTEGAASREVYLPEHKPGWYDFHTGERYAGGDTVTVSAPLDEIPLFVKGGSIIPTIDPVQHTGESVGRPIMFRIYPGADAQFNLYEDAGDGYGFEKGESQDIAVLWLEGCQTVAISDTLGTYPGAPVKREFRFVMPDGKMKKTVYTGIPHNIQMK